MAKERRVLLPKQQRTFERLGENIKLARLRRDLTAEQVAERAGISRTTLTRVEKADPGTSIGIYQKVLFVLRLDQDLAKVAEDNMLGRRLQDAKLIPKERASKK